MMESTNSMISRETPTMLMIRYKVESLGVSDLMVLAKKLANVVEDVTIMKIKVNFRMVRGVLGMTQKKKLGCFRILYYIMLLKTFYS